MRDRRRGRAAIEAYIGRPVNTDSLALFGR
jgi:hypothetical protein